MPFLDETGLASYDTKIKGVINNKLSEIEYGEIVLTDGQLVTGLYFSSAGFTSSSAAKTAVFPVKSGVTYYVTWGTGSNKYRTAFGNVAPGSIAVGTPVYDYVDNNTTSHDKYPRTNSEYSYLYIYIGNTNSTDINSVSVTAKIKTSIDDCMASDGDQW